MNEVRVIRRAAAALLIVGVTSAPANAQEPSPLLAGPVRAFETADGLRVVIARQPRVDDGIPRAFVGVYTRHGTTGEGIPGMAHMAEHVFANSAPVLSDYAIPDDLERLASNAQARPDYVSAWTTVPTTALEPIVLAYSAKLWGIRDTDEQIERQRQRVVAELGRGVTVGSWNAGRAVEEAFYGNRPGPDDEAGYTLDYAVDDVRRYLRHAYRPEDVVLVIAGDVDPEALETTLRARFAARGPIPRPTGAIDGLFRPVGLAAERESVVRTGNDDGTVWVSVGILAPPRASREYTAMLVLDQLLLGGRQDFEELWDIARDPDGPFGRRLTAYVAVLGVGDGRGYGAASPPLAEDDPAFFTLLFQTPELDPARARDVALGALRDVRERDMSDATIERAKRELLAFYRRWLSTEDLRPLGDHLAGMTLHDPAGAARLLSLGDEIAAIPPTLVREVMDRHVLQGDLRLGIVPPEDGL